MPVQNPIESTAAHHGNDPLMAELTPPQREAVLHDEGPLLVLAAAGSGKTRVITRRIARLLRDGAQPWGILALTFTNKAAQEMRERVGSSIGGAPDAPPRGLVVTTFHALCARLLRRFAEEAREAGVPAPSTGYTIAATTDQMAIVKQVVADAGMSSSNWPPRSVLSAISNAKNDLLTPETLESTASDYYTTTIAKLYHGYQAALRRADAVDFDDLLLMTVRILKECKNIREQMQNRWRHVMVDEYQDTNTAQFALTELLAPPTPTRTEKHPATPDNDELAILSGDAVPNVPGAPAAATARSLCVVGDPDQAIYGWRGANIRNILDFEDRYPDAEVIALGQNFRSTAPILTAADALIRHNQRRKHKPLFTNDTGGAPVRLVHCRDDRHEASVVADWLTGLQRGETQDADGHGGAVQWKDAAVFYRTNALSRNIEDELRARAIPYRVARGVAYYEREEVRDAISYLRVVRNRQDDVSVRRIVNKPTRGIGAASLEKAAGWAAGRGLALYDGLEAAARGDVEGILPRASKAIGKFTEMVKEWRGESEATFMGHAIGGAFADLVERVVRESGLEQHHAAKAAKAGMPGDDKRENLAELVSSALEFEDLYDPDEDPVLNDPQGLDDAMGTAPPETQIPAANNNAEPKLLTVLAAYLERVALVSDADAVDPKSGAVTLMTLHAAKGLEFPAVAVVGLEEGVLPHSRAWEAEDELEEERRLCFVGVTRAMRRLLLTNARTRLHRGQVQRMLKSRFLGEIPGDVMLASDLSDPYATMGRAADEPMENRSDAGTGVRVEPVFDDGGADIPEPGTSVRHPRFGVGRVLKVMGGSAGPKVRVRFQDAGEKTIVLGFAPLEIL